MTAINQDAPGRTALLMGNEAIARGAVEAGVSVCAGYPGNPSSEIIATLAQAGPDLGRHVEWSVNEKVALETAMAASFTGLRGLAVMKQNGLNVAADALMTLAMTGCRGGLVVVVCDDPGAISSNNEEDTRAFAKIGDLPLLEPAHIQEAKDITRWAFELSEKLALPVLVRSTTRVSHARGAVVLGELAQEPPQPWFDASAPFISVPPTAAHQALKDKLKRAGEIFEQSPFNYYQGPKNPELLVVTSGVDLLYTQEAALLLQAEERIGICKLGATWPLPEKFVLDCLRRSDRILFVEEVDAFLEDNVMALAARHGAALGPKEFLGRGSGALPRVGETNPDLAATALAKILGTEYSPRDPEYAAQAREAAALAPERQIGFCAGCPHRASYWSIKNALALDGRKGFVVGDIGCYSMGFGPSGFFQLKTLHAMGSGPGVAGAMGRLAALGLDQPALTVIGDSTFFHAALPALANASYNGGKLLTLILDNSATAMTGFQPHPGTGLTAMGKDAQVLDIEAVCRALGAHVEVADPFDLEDSCQALTRLLKRENGLHVLIMRRECALKRSKREGPSYKMSIDPERCLGQECGCNRLCTRIFKCPGLSWDKDAGRARIEETICIGCGVCTQICPGSAIIAEPAKEAA